MSNERIAELEKELELAKKEAKDLQRTTKFNELKKHIGLVYYRPFVSPGTLSFSLVYVKNIKLIDDYRLHVFLEEVTCCLSSLSNTISYGRNIEYYDIFTNTLFHGHTYGLTTVSIDVFKTLKHRAKTSVKSFMEIMKTLSDLKIPSITDDNMSEEHKSFDVDFPHIKTDDLMGFLDHTPFTIGNKYLLTPKSVEFAYAKIRDYRKKDAACSGLYEACDSAYLSRMFGVIESIDRQLLNFSTKI